MRRRTLLAGLLLSVAVTAQETRLPVVATFSILADMTREVGGDAVAVIPLVPPDGDAHSFQPRPGDLRMLRTARVVVENGLGLEGWTTRLIASSGFAGTRITAAGAIPPRTVREGKRTVRDPHVWQDPRRAVLMVQAIANGLASADPAQAVAYRARAADYAARIEAVDREIEQAMAAIPSERRRVITSHDAFGYYGDRYGIEFRAVQGVSTAGEPSARDLARLAAQVRREGIRAVFVESMADPRLAEALARESGARVGGRVYSDSLSAPDGPAATYLSMLRHNTALFAAAMQPDQ